ncbi:MAG: hypothetical protein KKA64_02410 [Nanoarchaeota archaeon]|nr:hypothetical protein [Nanoarchaeota archaeon]
MLRNLVEGYSLSKEVGNIASRFNFDINKVNEEFMDGDSTLSTEEREILTKFANYNYSCPFMSQVGIQTYMLTHPIETCRITGSIRY